MVKIRSRKKQNKIMSLTPLIDVLFLLMVFFMLTTKFAVSTGINLDLTTVSKSNKQTPKSDSLLITVLDNDNVDLSGIEYTKDKLSLVLEEYFIKSPNKPVVLAPENEYVSTQDIIDVIDVVTDSGGKNVSLVKGEKK